MKIEALAVAKCPETFWKTGVSLECRRSYLRGLPTVNCNGVRTKKAKIAIFKKPWVPRTQDKLSVRLSDG